MPGAIDRLINTQIDQCVQDIEGAKVMFPDELSSSNQNDQLIHVTFNSAIFGFLDDMYIMNTPYEMSGSTSTTYRALEI